MTTAMPDIFSKIADASATQNGNWMRDGKYLLAIKECKCQELYSGWTWITEFIVVSSEPIPGMLQVGGEPCAPGTPGATQVEPNAPGEKVSFVATLGNKNTPNAAGDVKHFLLMLSNTAEAKFNQDEADAKRLNQPSPFAITCAKLTGPEQLMRGALILAQTSRKVNQGRSNLSNKGKILVKPSFSHVPLVMADIQARRALIEQGLPIPVPTHNVS